MTIGDGVDCSGCHFTRVSMMKLVGSDTVYSSFEDTSFEASISRSVLLPKRMKPQSLLFNGHIAMEVKKQ